MNNIKAKTLILIPAYMPDQRLISLIDELYASGFTHQLIINDGSNADCEPVFAQVREREFCRLLVHEVNMGKGQALKTGFKEFCDNMPECDFVVTADADGQHCCKDITNVAVAVNEHPADLVLGVRNFAQKHVPLHNKLGNNITKGVISLYMGNPISDTQTGLRAMSKKLAGIFLKLNGQRYEYE
ncbi:MAG: glycosyltransferase family 2 protein, partial [Firmicutes bacterium]|nr:glycosyltransferase family 2 protein [Bacillota bacterium]